jgi:phage-related protein
MKKIVFMGHSLHDIKKFPSTIKREMGFELDKIQNGYAPVNWKPMQSIASGVREIRVRDLLGIYRVIYIAKFKKSVYVLHAFQKKTQKTNKTDIDIAIKAYKNILKENDHE